MRYIKPTLILLLLFSGLSGLSCDNTMNPFKRDKGLYSIYGYLDIDKDVNYIRIKDLNSAFVPESTRTIDARVTLKNLDNGADETLKDSVKRFDGLYTHNFRTTLAIHPDTRYELTARRSDGKTATAVATTPQIVEVKANPVGVNCQTPTTIKITPISSLSVLDLYVGFKKNKQKFYWKFDPLSYFTKEGSPKTYYLRFSPQKLIDLRFPVRNPPPKHKFRCYQLDTDSLFVKYTIYGPDFFKDKGPDSLKIPGGTGQFGGLYDRSFSFPIDTVKLCTYCKN